MDESHPRGIAGPAHTACASSPASACAWATLCRGSSRAGNEAVEALSRR